ASGERDLAGIAACSAQPLHARLPRPVRPIPNDVLTRRPPSAGRGLRPRTGAEPARLRTGPVPFDRHNAASSGYGQRAAPLPPRRGDPMPPVLMPPRTRRPPRRRHWSHPRAHTLRLHRWRPSPDKRSANGVYRPPAPGNHRAHTGLSQPAGPGPGGAPRGPAGQSYWHDPPSALGWREIAPNSETRDRPPEARPASPPSGAARGVASRDAAGAQARGARRPTLRPSGSLRRTAVQNLISLT